MEEHQPPCCHSRKKEEDPRLADFAEILELYEKSKANEKAPGEKSESISENIEKRDPRVLIIHVVSPPEDTSSEVYEKIYTLVNYSFYAVFFAATVVLWRAVLKQVWGLSIF
jgi:hypothetical protein